MRIEFQYGSAWYTVATKYEWPGGVVVQLITLGHNLAVAGALEASFNLGMDPVRWMPNLLGDPAPTWPTTDV
jgi:hypothetical protein